MQKEFSRNLFDYIVKKPWIDSKAFKFSCQGASIFQNYDHEKALKTHGGKCSN